MAKEVVINIKAESAKAQNSLEQIEETLSRLEREAFQAEVEIAKLNKELASGVGYNEQQRLTKLLKEQKDVLAEARLGMKAQNLDKKDILKTNKLLNQSESDLTEEVTKNGGAIAILNQVTGGMAQQFKDAYEAIGLANGGLKGFKGAMLATGIGAFVIALGYLITNFDDLRASMLGVTEQSRKMNEAMGQVDIAVQQSTATIESLTKVVNDETASEVARNEALIELQKIIPELNDVTLDQADAMQEVKDKTDIYIEAIKARAKAEAFAKIIAEEQAEIIRQQNKSIDEQITFTDQLRLGASMLYDVLRGNNADETGSAIKTIFVDPMQESLDLIAQLEVQYDKLLQTSLEKNAEIGKNTRKAVSTVSEITTKGVASVADFSIKTSEQELKVTEKTEKEKQKVTLESLSGIAQLLGESSAFGKGLSIAMAIRDTYAGASKALAQGGIFGAVAAAGIIASGLANVRAITSTPDPQPPSFATGASSSGGGNIIAPSAPPAFNVVGASATNQLAGAIGSQSQKPVQAFVVSNDVTTAQSLERNIIQGASIG